MHSPIPFFSRAFNLTSVRSLLAVLAVAIGVFAFLPLQKIEAFTGEVYYATAPGLSDQHCTSCAPSADQDIYIPLSYLPEAQGGQIVFNSRSGVVMSVTPVFYTVDVR